MKFANKIKSITIGSFDGLHIGHQALISQADAVVIIERNSGYLTPGHKRSEFTDKPCYFYHFEKIKSLTPDEFINRLKVDFPMLCKIVIGYDFHFGKNKAGNAQMLKDQSDLEIVIVDEVSIDGIAVHSRTIKEYLSNGNIELANRLLGRRYHIEGEVIPGQGLGKKELVPTLNLKTEHYHLPLEGVYATKSKIVGEWLPSVSFLGHRMSTDGSFAIETHILSGDVGLVDGNIEIEFVAWIRENRTFGGLDDLREAILEDIETANQILNTQEVV